jgi:hypothetical protein
MAGSSVTVYLPFSTTVTIQSFVNAAYRQRVKIQPQGRPPIVFAGSGYEDTPIGKKTIRTPDGFGKGFPVVVTVEHSQNNGLSWQPSQVDAIDSHVMYYALAIVVSEDSTNNTWDDATTYFSWTDPPSENLKKVPQKVISQLPRRGRR